jgi:hypothetical protein
VRDPSDFVLDPPCGVRDTAGTVSADRLIPRLLARRDRLGRVEKDAIFEAVLAGSAPPKRRWTWLAVIAPALAAAGLVIALAPWRSSHDEFASRGSARPVAMLHARCATACTTGAKLLFDTYGTTSYRYVAVFAKRGDGTVVWLVPDSVELTATGVLDRGVVIDDAGTYRVYGVFSNAPLAKAAIRDAFDETALTAGPATAVVTSDVEVR